MKEAASRVRPVIGLMLLMFSSVCVGQTPPLPRIGWIMSGTAENSRHMVQAVRAGLADEGLLDGRSVILDVRFTGDDLSVIRRSLPISPGNPLRCSPQQASPAFRPPGMQAAGERRYRPYFCGSEVQRMVETFARPGGNITGVACLSTELVIKRVELLKLSMPNLRRLGFLYDPRNPGKEKELAQVRQSAAGLGVSVSAASASSVEALCEAIEFLHRDGAEAVVISEDVFTATVQQSSL
jgi:putative ABC transport system substrate-binding protein